MSKNKKTRKVLVRNSLAPVQCSKQTEENKKVRFSEDVLSDVRNPTFTAPEFCTLLQLADEMKSIRKARGTISLPDVNKYKNLNFLPEERIYQDLVPLDVPHEELVHEVRSQPILKLKKDPELDYQKYTEYDLEPEYFFTSSAKPIVVKQRIGFNEQSIYNKLKIWNEFRD